MEVNVCKNCENYRADGSCRKSNCSVYRKAQKIVDDYCDTREDCDDCPLHKLGCSVDWCEYRNQAFVQVATALQSQGRSRLVARHRDYGRSPSRHGNANRK